MRCLKERGRVMNEHIITVWGANGSGKTTTAVNLAEAISACGGIVGLISSKLYYGEMQVFFGKRVESDKGIYRALSNGCSTRNMFSETNNPSVFFLSAPNIFDGMLLTAVNGDMAKELIEDAAMRFDYLIIDGSEELNNPVSSMGLTLAARIITVHRASVRGCLWYSSMKGMMSLTHLNDKTINVLNGYDKTCDKTAYISRLNSKIDFELPYAENAKILENAGRLIYNSRGENGVYHKAMQKLAKQIIQEG